MVKSNIILINIRNIRDNYFEIYNYIKGIREGYTLLYKATAKTIINNPKSKAFQGPARTN